MPLEIIPYLIEVTYTTTLYYTSVVKCNATEVTTHTGQTNHLFLQCIYIYIYTSSPNLQKKTCSLSIKDCQSLEYRLDCNGVTDTVLNSETTPKEATAGQHSSTTVAVRISSSAHG